MTNYDNSLEEKLDTIITDSGLIKGYIDGLETLVTTLDSVLDNVLIELRKDPVTWDTWAFLEEYKASGIGNMALTIQPAINEKILLSDLTFVTYYASSLSSSIVVRDDGGQNFCALGNPTSSTATFHLPNQKFLEQRTASVASSLGLGYLPYEICYPDKLYFYVASVAADDRFRVLVRAKIEGITKPTVTPSGVAVDNSLATGYDEIL